MMTRIDKEKVLQLYDYYREAALPLVIILTCILLTLFLLLPQLISSFNSRSQYEIEKNTLQTLNDNYSYISVLDSSSLESNIDKISLAIPEQANFDSIIASIYYAAATSGMSIGQFQFGITSNTVDTNLPSISLILKVNSGPQENLAFIKEIYKTFPVSRVTTIRNEEKIKEMTIVFYYKPFISEIVNNAIPIPKITSSDEKILNELSSWKQPEQALAPAPSSTASGGFGPSFPF